MNRRFYSFLVVAGLFALTPLLQAQSGCVNSPENPTVILAAVGSAGALFVSVRGRIRARRKS